MIVPPCMVQIVSNAKAVGVSLCIYLLTVDVDPNIHVGPSEKLPQHSSGKDEFV